MAEHTEGPWITNGNGIERHEHGRTDVDIASCSPIDDGDGENWALAEANAEFIVLACNSYDALLEALEKLVDSLVVHAPSIACAPVTERHVTEARAALALAHGEPARA